MPPQLMALTDGPSILLDKPILLLGRHQECDIQLVSRKVSRRHCCIAQVGSYLVVRDLGSTNGIRINGIKVNEGNLKPGDELTIGNHRYEVRWEAVAGEPPVQRRRPTAVRKEPASPSPVPGRVMGDEMLESCDEPVPLAEPDPLDGADLMDDLPPTPADAPAAAFYEKIDEPVPGVPQLSPILPDEIALAPLSEVGPRNQDKKSD
jgi:predicted component of type VI protein secretion system